MHVGGAVLAAVIAVVGVATAGIAGQSGETLQTVRAAQQPALIGMFWLSNVPVTLTPHAPNRLSSPFLSRRL